MNHIPRDAKTLLAFWRQLKQRPYVPLKFALEMMEYPDRRFTMYVRRTGVPREPMNR